MATKEVQQVIKAWTDAGPMPEYHHEAQLKLRRDWPVLADAVIALVAAEKEGN